MTTKETVRQMLVVASVYLFGLLALSITNVFPAPVPMAPDEDLRTFASRSDFDAETIERGGKVLGTEDYTHDKGHDDVRHGSHTRTERGWYATYYYTDRLWLMSTIPDGRLKYALFDGETGEPAKWANEFAPKACVRCHDKTNTVEKVP